MCLVRIELSAMELQCNFSENVIQFVCLHRINLQYMLIRH